MMEHIEQNNDHCITFSMSDASFWCYKCENYIISPELTNLMRYFSYVKHSNNDSNLN